jgi:hypothetical protein
VAVQFDPLCRIGCHGKQLVIHGLVIFNGEKSGRIAACPACGTRIGVTDMHPVMRKSRQTKAGGRSQAERLKGGHD